MQSLLSVISENVRFYRKKTGLSQLKLAYQLEMSPSYLAEIERGRQYPSIKMLEKIAAFFGVEPYQILRPLNLEGNTPSSFDYEHTVRAIKQKVDELFVSLLQSAPKSENSSKIQ